MIDDIEKGQEKLRNVSNLLKSKYHGIGNVIDEIISQIETWYLFDELLYKPIVINLASMTSCGKTSVVRDLVKSLNMYEQYLEIDLTKSYEGGRHSPPFSYNNPSTGFISARIFDKFEDTDSKGIVFIDEFQKIPENPASYKEIWSLLADGKIGNSHHKIDRIDSCIKILHSFINDYKDTMIELEYMKNSAGPDNINFNQSSFSNGNFNNMRGWNPLTTPIPLSRKYLIENFLEVVKITTIDQLQPLFDFHDFGMNTTGFPFGTTNYIRKQFELGKITIKEILLTPGYSFVHPLIEIATAYRKSLVEKYSTIIGRDPLIFSKLLIFTAQNVDGLYVDSRNTNISAEELHEKTLKLTVDELKKELLKQFRPEEVSRMGSTFIIYPSLSLKAFQMIITDKIVEVESDIFRMTGIVVNLRSKKFLEYLEKESIVASQGARPAISRVYTELNKVIPKLVKMAKLNRMKAISVSDLEEY